MGDSSFWGPVLGVLGAALPGVLVALVAHYFTQRRENQQQRRVNANTRMLVALELDANRNELASFWRTINELDTEHRDGAEAHLAAMARNGLLGYTLPAFSFRQWEHLSSQAAGALSPKEIEQTYAAHADLHAIGDMYTKIVTIPPKEMKDYTTSGTSMNTFWYNYFAGNRVGLFERLQQAVQRMLDAGNPVEK